MRHTLRDVTFECPDDLRDFSEYTYVSPDERDIITVQPEEHDGGDAAATLADTRDRYEGVWVS